MARPVLVTWDKQDTVGIPNAAAYNQYDVQILKQEDNSQVADLTVPFGTFDALFSLEPGDYIASVSAMDNDGNVAAPPATAAFTLPAEPTVPVPFNVAVSFPA